MEISKKLDMFLSMFNSATIIDTSGIEHVALAVLKKGKCIATANELPEWFKENLPKITALVIEPESK